jgi:hypothetical protein
MSDEIQTPMSEMPAMPRRRWDWLGMVLQVGHRAASLGFIALVIAMAAVKTKFFEARPIATGAFLGCDIGMLCAVGGWFLAARENKPQREAIGLLIFSAVVGAGALVCRWMANA